MTSAVASIEEVRSRFPALAREHRGRPVAYFDGPGGTQVPRSVIDSVADYLAHHNANTHWAFPTSEETDAALTLARSALADFLGASPGEVAFGANMTTLTFHLARALGRRLGPGDEIVVTELDHRANVDPWLALVADRGVTIRTARMDPRSGTTDRDDLAAQIGERTRIVAVGAASNALGTITNVSEIAEMAHAVGAVCFVDAVHYAPHRLVDVEAMHCDFLACSAYKFYGPHVGILYGRHDLLQSLDVPKLKPAPDSAPSAWRRALRITRGSSERRRRSSSSPRWPRGRAAETASASPSTPSTSGPKGWSSGSGTASRRFPGSSFSALHPRTQGRPPSRSPSRADRRKKSPDGSPTSPCSSPTAISTPRRPSRGSGTRKTASSGWAARAIPRRTRSIA